MKRLFTAVSLLLMTACPAPRVEPSPDGGVDAGVTGGGAATGGGSATGGGTATGGGGGATGGGTATDDAGTPEHDGGVSTDAGFPLKLPPLPLADCGKARAFTCAHDDAGCITWETPGTQQVLVNSFELSTFNGIFGAIDDELLFLQTSPTAGDSLVGLSATRPHVYGTQSGNDFLGNAALSRAPPSEAVWTVAGYFIDDQFNEEFRVHRVANGAVATVATRPTRPTSNGVAYGERYVTAFASGVYSYDVNGESPVVLLSGSQFDRVMAVAVDEAHAFIFYVRWGGPSWNLWRHEIATGTQVQLATLPPLAVVELQRGSVLEVHGDWVYAMSPIGVFRTSALAPGPVETVFEAEMFPNFYGTLKQGSLVRHGDKLYFGKMCLLDEQDPGYGTVELDLSAGTARWLDLDPNFPVVPHVVGYSELDALGPVYATPTGVFIRRE